MPIDPAVAVGAELPEIKFSWTQSDVLLYHLALGATELRYVYEEGLRVLPTFGVVAPRFHETAPPAVNRHFTRHVGTTPARYQRTRTWL